MLLRLMINFWILVALLGSVALVTMVFAFILVLFKEMMEKLRKNG